MRNRDLCKRRRLLDYDKFDVFVADQKAMCFVQCVSATEDDPDFAILCDCSIGVKGETCIHAIAQYFREGLMVGSK